MRRAIAGAMMSVALLAAAAPVASADQAAVTVNVLCNGTAIWTVDQVQSVATVQTTASTCKRLDASVDDAGNLHVDTADGPYTGQYKVNLLAAGLFGQNTFVAVADRGSIPIGPVVATAGILNAELTAPNPAVPGASQEIHRGTGSCGLHCYETAITWVHAYDRMP